MNVTWGTYPSHLGHRGKDGDKRGCFRCHDDENEIEDGKTLSQDCDLCHEMIEEDVSADELPEAIRGLLGK